MRKALRAEFIKVSRRRFVCGYAKAYALREAFASVVSHMSLYISSRRRMISLVEIKCQEALDSLH